MESIDEFDVDISKLWKWNKEVVIKDGDEVLFKAYLRVPGDADINRARVYALRESAKLRKAISDKSNEERWAYLLPKELISEAELIDFVKALLLRDELRNIDKEVDIPIPKKPDEDAPLEEHEKYQEEVDNWVFKRLEKIREVTERKSQEIENYVKSLSFDELYGIYEVKSIDLYCENLVGTLFIDQCIYYGLFKDPKFTKKVFNSFEEFLNIPTYAKEELRKIYNDLSLSAEELKK